MHQHVHTLHLSISQCTDTHTRHNTRYTTHMRHNTRVFLCLCLCLCLPPVCKHVLRKTLFLYSGPHSRRLPILGEGELDRRCHRLRVPLLPCLQPQSKRLRIRTSAVELYSTPKVHFMYLAPSTTENISSSHARTPRSYTL